MQDAFPDSHIEITKQATAYTSMTSTTIAIEGVRRDVAPSGMLARQVAVECKLDHNVVVDFHWTAGPFS